MKSKGDFRVIDVDLGYDRLAKTITELGKTVSKAGVLSTASKEVKLKAAKNQFGGPSSNGGQIPARPFLTQAWDAGGVDEYASLLLGSLEEYLDKQDISAVERGFTITAAIAAQDIQEAIRAGDFVELSPVTVKLKGHDTILQHTKELLNAIDSETVEQKGPFRPADTQSSAAQSLFGAARGSGGRRVKRKRKSSLRKVGRGGLASLAKSPGYEGRGIRKRADRRPNAAAGTTSRGVRRPGLRF